MKDMPVFTTQHGVASLTLREIPYSARAYIRIQSTVDLSSLLVECVDFCRAVGAESVYATGDDGLGQYPLHTEIVEMVGSQSDIGKTDAVAYALTAAELTEFREVYNRKMADVPNAAYMTARDAQSVLEQGHGYVVRRNGNLLGIGIAAEGTVEMIAGIVPGAGRAVLAALCSVLEGTEITVEVASANKRAMRLYEQLGFRVQQTVARWHKIL